MNQPANPYSAPSATSANQAEHPSIRGIYGWASWFALASGVWFGRMLMLSVYQEFDVALPTVTLLILHPLASLVLAVVGLGFLAAVMLTREPRTRRLLILFSVVVAMGVGAVATYGLFGPLVVMIHLLG